MGRLDAPASVRGRAELDVTQGRPPELPEGSLESQAHRSDRRRDTPITRMALDVALADWDPTRGFHDGPEPIPAPRMRPKIRLLSESRARSMPLHRNDNDEGMLVIY